MGSIKLHWQILIAIVLAVIAGVLTGTDTAIAGVAFYDIYAFLGTLFLNALKMVIVPLIMASIITGISGLGGENGLGKMGIKTLGFYALSSTLAILVGLFFVNLLAPGIIDGEPARDQLGLGVISESIADKVEGKGQGDLVEIFLRMVPTNIVAAAAEGQMLGLIFFSLLFGYFMTRIDKTPAEALKNLWQGIADTMMKITMLIMKFSPYGVFGLVAKTVASTGFDAFLPLLTFFITVLLALAFHTFISMPALIFLFTRLNPLNHFKAMFPALLTSFSTASSSATLPVTLECVEKNAGVSSRTSSFVLPLGATVNMDGTALYECVAAMFIAQAYGIEMSLTVQFTVVLMALLTSIGVAGIPAASLVAISIILGAIGLPLEAIGLILVTDRILDMCRTSVNVFGDSCGAVIIAHSEGETGLLEGKAGKVS
ncbi:MAG: dicarboxylate/amino acid:cation symporter [Pseudomonadales bacterium]|nr:dicarboxylate/amino acid:cation symporter [Pseudomonadales bacterium]